MAHSSARYQAHPHDDQALAERLEQIKHKYPRFGVPRAHAVLRAEGQEVNRKRVARVWRKSGLQVVPRPKRRKIKTGRLARPSAPITFGAMTFRRTLCSRGVRYAC